MGDLHDPGPSRVRQVDSLAAIADQDVARHRHTVGVPNEERIEGMVGIEFPSVGPDLFHGHGDGIDAVFYRSAVRGIEG